MVMQTRTRRLKQMIKGENSRKDLERSLPTVYICSRYRPKSADPERQKIE